MRVTNTERFPVKMWLSDIEDGAAKQIKNLANLPFLFRHVAIMPDSHQGYGMPIGGVIATDGAVVPNAVGVDIGCGMCAVKTYLYRDEIAPERLKRVMGTIRETVPVGFAHHPTSQGNDKMPSYNFDTDDSTCPIVYRQWKAATCQIGTLGGGNHFIEVQRDTVTGEVWVMIHSGSRNLGKQVADHYNRLAVDLNQRWHTAVPKEWELAFLPFDSIEGQRYIAEMKFCVEFAHKNRLLMLERIIAAFAKEFPCVNETLTGMVNIAHNYAAMENHFGKNVLVHRKGATRAYAGEQGIIPGSQGTKSYIVRGKGNPESFKSCSHGAGRRMGRKQATRELSLADEVALLDSQGIIHGIRNQADLDEAAGAYKDIAEVMANQTDLVDIEVELTPMAVVKG